MMIEFLYHLVTLDLVWFVELVMFNLHYLFAVFAVLFIILGTTKKAIWGTFLTFIQVWVLDDFTGVLGWVFIVGSFAILYYVCKMSVLAIVFDDPKMQKHLLPINEAAWMIPLILFNLVMTGVI